MGQTLSLWGVEAMARWWSRGWAAEVGGVEVCAFMFVCPIFVSRAGRGWQHWPLLCIVRRKLSDGGQADGGVDASAECEVPSAEWEACESDGLQ